MSAVAPPLVDGAGGAAGAAGPEARAFGPGARFPAGRAGWRSGPAVVGAGVLFALLLGTLALVWRARGVPPTAGDSPARWALARAALPAGDPGAVALLGSSRMRGDVCPKTLAARLPGRPAAQLGVDGFGFAGALRGLAGDETFRGLVVVGLTEFTFTEDPAATAAYTAARDPGPGGRWAERISAQVRARASVLHRNTTWRRVVPRALAAAPLPRDAIAEESPARFIAFDFAGTAPAAVAASRARWERPMEDRLRAPPRSPADRRAAWDAAAARVTRQARRIAARGGRVAFVRMPTEGARRAAAAAEYPRQDYWDRFAAGFAGKSDGADDAGGAVTAVHFEDVPALGGLRCPDGSHLDAADRPAFTRALLDELARRGVL